MREWWDGLRTGFAVIARLLGYDVMTPAERRWIKKQAQRSA